MPIRDETLIPVTAVSQPVFTVLTEISVREVVA